MEKSCGAVVYTGSREDPRYLIIYSQKGFYGFPKGHVEGDETEEETARREIREETGLTDIKFIDGFRTSVVRPVNHRIEGAPLKEVVYFLAYCENPHWEAQEAEIAAIRLMTYEEAMEIFQFETARKVLREAHAFLTGR